MADYISQFTGPQIDQAIGKSNSINKSATEINVALSSVDKIDSGIASAGVGEILAKKSNGGLEGTGIINEQDKIFFPKDGRFPAASIDVGPAITISENGGWTQYHSNTLNKDYIFVDYEISKQGTTRPVYWERLAEEKNVVIHADNSQDITISTFDHIPTTDSQVNALYFNFTNPVTNLIIEVVSLDTNLPIKYIPNEVAWKNGTGGLNLQSGVQDVLLGKLPLSALTVYHLRFNIKTPVTIKGLAGVPYLAVDRQKINSKGIALVGEGTGGSSTFTALTDTPSNYTGAANRVVAVKSDSSGLEFIVKPEVPAASVIATALNGLVGNERIDASAIKNLPAGVDISSKANVDLSDVSNTNMLRKGEDAGLLQQDMASVDLDKLAEKVTDSKVLDQLATKTTVNAIESQLVGKLHSYDELMQSGFEQMTFAYGLSVNNTLPLNNGWVIARNLLGKDLSYTNTLITTPQHIIVTLPYIAEKVIENLLINNVVAPVEKYDYLLGNMREIVYITKGTFNVAVGINIKFEFIGTVDNGGLTYDEIATQFATKLHTFAEINSEFATKLHTFYELEQNRFVRDWIAYGTSNSGAIPEESDKSWIFSYMRLSGNGEIIEVLRPPAYVIVKISKIYDLLITGVKLNGATGVFNRMERTEGGTVFVYYISKTVEVISNANITFDLFSNVPVTPPTLSIGNDIQTFQNITDIDFINADVTQQPSELNKVTVVPHISVQGTNDTINKIKKIKFMKGIVDIAAGDANTAEITTQIAMMQNGGQEKLINSLEVEYPLRFTFNDPEQRGELSVDDVFDFRKPEGIFLKGRAITYLKDFDGTSYHADIEHFTKEVYEGNDLALTGDEIQIKRPVGIYTGFPKVPLVSYGRMAFQGFAPREGFIEIGLRDVTTKATILGSYGETISRTRSYLANEKLYYLDFFSVFEVDFTVKNVEIYIKHSFGQDYDLKVSDDVDGGSCIMMQFVSQDYKTGVALDEVRGQYNVILPFEIFELTAGQPLAGYSLELNGVIPKTGITGVFNRQGFCEIGTADKEAFFEMASTGLNITSKDDSTPSYAYISLMLNTELTQVFKNDNLILTVNLTLKDVMSALDIIPITWTGIANEIPKGIVGSIPDNFIPVPTDNGWTFDNANAHFIQMDMSDFNPRTISVDFAVPQNAVNFGVLVVPHAVANAMKIHVQGLNFTPKVTDVAPMLKPIVRLGDSYLFNSVKHGQYTWDFPPTTSTDKIQGLALGTNPTQIPISKRVYGDAAVKLIKINGLNYHVMEFASAGKAKIDSTWTLTRPKSHFVHPSHTAKVYFAVATDNGSGGYNLSKITQSEATHSIDVEYPTVIQVTTPTFTYDVVAGTILVAMGTCSSADDVYVAMSHGGDRPIIVDVEYTESVTGTSSDTPIGILYTEDELGAVWEIKTAADGHIESQKIDDLPENIVHHITRGDLNLNDFTITDGVVSIRDVITPEEQSILDKIALIDSEIVVTADAIANKCYIELDYRLGKPVLTAKQRV